MSGPRHHHLAAAYLAGFSRSPAPRPRESVLWVGRRGLPERYRRRAEAVAYKKNLYTLGTSVDADRKDAGQGVPSIDDTWTWVEPSRRCDSRFDEILQGSAAGSPVGLGSCSLRRINGEEGYTIPLNRRAALALIRAESGSHVVWDKRARGWFVEGIEHTDLTQGDVDELNAALRESALVECYGSEAALVHGDMDGPSRDPTEDPFFEPHLLMPSPDWLRTHEDSWAKMMTITSRAPRDASEDQPWAVMAELAPEESSMRVRLHKLLFAPQA